MHQITRRFEWDAAHRVLGHQGKCRFLHGHRYSAEVTVRASAELDKLGMVVDFSVLKEKVGKWIDDNWDHNCILNGADPLFSFDDNGQEIFGRKPFVFATLNPTAEIMAQYLFMVAQKELEEHYLEVISVVVFETPNCRAEYRP